MRHFVVLLALVITCSVLFLDVHGQLGRDILRIDRQILRDDLRIRNVDRRILRSDIIRGASGGRILGDLRQIQRDSREIRRDINRIRRDW